MSEDLDSDPPRPPFLYPFDRDSVTVLRGQALHDWLDKVAPVPPYKRVEKIRYPRERRERKGRQWQR